jgi:hypothetical protein
MAIWLLAGQDSDDVGDPRRASELMAPCVRFLHADVEADLSQLARRCIRVPARSREFPTGRLPIVPASTVTWVEALVSLKIAACRRAGRREQQEQDQAGPRAHMGR